VPPAQGEHWEAPAAGATVPAAHGVGAVAPVPHELPAGHGAHSPAAARSVAFECEPAGHGSAAAALVSAARRPSKAEGEGGWRPA